jgi:hypothetical protein
MNEHLTNHMRFVFPAGRGSCNTVRMSVLGIQILSGRVGHLYAFPYFPDFSRKFTSTSSSSLSTFSEKTKRMYQMDQTDIENVEKIFDQLK